MVCWKFQDYFMVRWIAITKIVFSKLSMKFLFLESSMKGKDSRHSSSDSRINRLSTTSDCDTANIGNEPPFVGDLTKNNPDLKRQSETLLQIDNNEVKTVQESSKIRVRDLASLECLATHHGHGAAKRYCSPNQDLEESYSDLKCERQSPDDDPLPQDLSKNSKVGKCKREIQID